MFPLTTYMVLDPVIPNTVQRRTISLYQSGDHLGGISFGAIHFCNQLADSFVLVPPAPAPPLFLLPPAE
jgi:hypothetical protein